jgi:hypothetical protein
MNRFAKSVLLMVLLLALFGSYRFVSAQETQSPSPIAVNDQENVPSEEAPPALATDHVLMATYLNQFAATTGIPFSGGSLAIDPLTSISCPAAIGKTCTIEAEIYLQAQSNTGGRIALTFALDGTKLSSPFVGTLTSNFAMFSWPPTARTVSRGNHTVQSFLNTDFSGNSGSYNINYRVYVP